MAKQDIGKQLNRRLVRTGQTAEAYNLLVKELRKADKALKELREIIVLQAESISLCQHKHDADRVMIDALPKVAYLFAAALIAYGSHRYDCGAPKKECTCGFGPLSTSAKENNARFDGMGLDLVFPPVPAFKKGHLTVVSAKTPKK